MYKAKKHSISLYSPMNLLGLIFMLTLNTLAVVLPLNGLSTGELSDRYPNLFVPVGLTFSIWGLLYVCLIGFVISTFAIDRSQTNRHKNPLAKITPLFVLSCLLNGLWIVAWHYLWLLASLVIMVSLLLTLILLYDQLELLRYDTLLEKFFLKGTISLYTGWISVALIANIAAYWVSSKPSSYGLSEVLWTLIVIGVATLLGMGFSLAKSDLLYSAVILWAFYGVYLKHVTELSSTYPSIVLALKIAMGLVGVSMAGGLVRLFFGKKNLPYS